MLVNMKTVDPDNKGTFYVATDNGVYVSYNTGESWDVLGNGLPTVPVLDLNLHTPTRSLLAATFGRSMYLINVKESAGVDLPIGEEPKLPELLIWERKYCALRNPQILKMYQP